MRTVQKDQRTSRAARRALQRDTVCAVAVDPTADETARSWARAWKAGMASWNEIPAQYRPEV